jgi:hypothetical protein
MENIIENGKPYYFNEFTPVEEIKPLGLDPSSLSPLIKFNDNKVIGKDSLFIMPDEHN